MHDTVSSGARSLLPFSLLVACKVERELGEVVKQSMGGGLQGPCLAGGVSEGQGRRGAPGGPGSGRMRATSMLEGLQSVADEEIWMMYGQLAEEAEQGGLSCEYKRVRGPLSGAVAMFQLFAAPPPISALTWCCSSVTRVPVYPPVSLPVPMYPCTLPVQEAGLPPMEQVPAEERRHQVHQIKAKSNIMSILGGRVAS